MSSVNYTEPHVESRGMHSNQSKGVLLKNLEHTRTRMLRTFPYSQPQYSLVEGRQLF